MTEEADKTDEREAFIVTTSDAPTEEQEAEPAEPAEPEASAEQAEETAEAEAEPDGDADDADGTDGDDHGLPPSLKKRLERARKAREREEKRAEEAEARLEKLREEAEQSRKELEKLKRRAKADQLDITDFDSIDEYEAEIEKIMAGDDEDEKSDDSRPEMIDGVPAERFVAAQTATINAIRKADPELYAKLDDAEVTITAPMVIAIDECQYPVEVVRKLIADPDLSERISRMSETKRILALDRLDTPPQRREKPASKKVSDAPVPPEVEKGNAAPVQGGYDTMSFADYEKRRAKEIRGRGGWL